MKQYRVDNNTNMLALPFKPGFYTNTNSYNNLKIKEIYFPVEPGSVINVYEDMEKTRTGYRPCWYFYSTSLRSTFFSSKAPNEIKWLLPYIENYNIMWSDLNI